MQIVNVAVISSDNVQNTRFFLANYAFDVYMWVGVVYVSDRSSVCLCCTG